MTGPQRAAFTRATPGMAVIARVTVLDTAD